MNRMGPDSPERSGLRALVVLEHGRTPRPNQSAAHEKLQAFMDRKKFAGAEGVRSNRPESRIFT
jgi:hypothetical protein